MKKHFLIAALGAALSLTFAACSTPQRDLPDGLYAEILTNKGDIVIELEPELAPMTVMNFVGLAEGTIDNDFRPGEPFYDGLTFHRVEPGFVIQGGDPQGDGRGGPGYRFPTETTPELLHDSEGVVAMANSGPDTNGSQFYITMGPTPHLDGGYNVFGQVVEGMDVVRQIEAGDRMREVNILRYGDEAEAYEASDKAFARLREAAAAEREAAAERARQETIDSIRERWPGIEEYEDTGLLLATIETGTGSTPEQGQEVSVHIVWSLLSGEQLDNTRDRNEPYVFRYRVDRLIEGLELAVGTMRVGETKVAVLPPELWTQGRPQVIPADAFVFFEIERLR